MADIIIVLILIVIAVFATQTDKETYAGRKSLLWRWIRQYKESKRETFRWSCDGNKDQ